MTTTPPREPAFTPEHREALDRAVGDYTDQGYSDLPQRFAEIPQIIDAQAARIAVLEAIINTPETDNFVAALPREAEHQRERWGADHDVGKQPLDWFWLIGYLAQKAADAAMRGDAEKAKHHTISTAAALANWHDALSGGGNRMRPGIDSAALAPIA